MQARRKAFLDTTLPSLFRDMRLLGIGIDDIVKEWNTHSGGTNG